MVSLQLKDMKSKNFRKRSLEVEDEDPDHEKRLALALEEVKYLQKQREKKSGIPALPIPAPSVASSGVASNSSAGGLVHKVNDKSEGDGEKDDLVLQDTFAQETAVMVEDPNMLRYVEQELAKKKGNNVDLENPAENEIKRAEDELYDIPEHLKVKRRNSGESSTQWTTGIAEIQLSIEYKLKNIEETEAAKKLLQEKRLAGRAKVESSIPSSFSADFSQRGKDYAEKLRKDNPKSHKDKSKDVVGVESKHPDPAPDAVVRRQAATDELMLERFRKRERQRVTRR